MRNSIISTDFMKKKYNYSYSSIQATPELKQMLDDVPGKTYEDKIWNLKEKKDSEVIKMVKEAVKKVVDERKERRDYWEAEDDATKKAREAFIRGEVKSPLCRKCFYDDFHDGRAKEWKEYCVSKKTRETKDLDKNPKSARFGQQLGVTYDFICPRKHGTSVSMLMAELEGYGKGKPEG